MSADVRSLLLPRDPYDEFVRAMTHPTVEKRTEDYDDTLGCYLARGASRFCDACGTRLWLYHEHVQDLRRRYDAKPFLSPLAHTDNLMHQETRGDSLGPAEYHAAVEDRLRPCACGGRFRYDAPPRCPACRSTDEMWDVDETGWTVIHD